MKLRHLTGRYVSVLAFGIATLLPVGPVVAQDQTKQTSYLLDTLWHQVGPYSGSTPKQERVGCWGTAIAQIMYFHRLVPHGQVAYQCTNGTKIEEDLSRFRFDWQKFVNTADDSSPLDTRRQLADYNYAAAVAVRKDFGTGSYLRLLNAGPDLEQHYDVDAEIYVCLGSKAPLSQTDLDAKLKSEGILNVICTRELPERIRGEIDAKRPVYFHFGNMTDFGHSTVIDGYQDRAGEIYVHINFGATESESTRWYKLFAPIAQADDETLRAVITIKPNGLKFQGSTTTTGDKF